LYLCRFQCRRSIVVPLTLLIIFIILYLNFRGVAQALLVMISVPLAAMGSVWLMWVTRFNTSIAVWVGMIALLGVATETTSMMVVYLDEGFANAQKEGRIHTMTDLIDVTIECATLRVRPLLMTVGMNIVGLIPVMFDTGIGSDVAKRIAAPLWGGLVSLTILVLLVIPAIYVIWRGFQLRHGSAPLGRPTCQAHFVECRSWLAIACNRPGYTEAAQSGVDLRAMSEGTGRNLRRRSIALRLALGLGAVLLVIGAVSVTCLWALLDIHARLHALKSDEERARSVVRLASAVRDQYAHVAHTIIIRNDSHAELFREATRQLNGLASTVRAEIGGAAGSEVDRIIQASREIDRLFETRVLPLARAGNGAALAEQHDQILKIALQAQREAESLARHAEESMEDLNRHVRATQHGVILMTIIAHIIALTTALIVGIYLYRTIARPIAALSEGAARVGRGDLDTVISIDREDELGQLSRRFNDMIASIKAHQKKLLQTERLVGLASMSAGIALRGRAHGCPDARFGWLRDHSPGQRVVARHRGRPDDGLRVNSRGRRCHPARGVRLPDQALRSG
jgi:HAMP domain-containing protein